LKIRVISKHIQRQQLSGSKCRWYTDLVSPHSAISE